MPSSSIKKPVHVFVSWAMERPIKDLLRIPKFGFALEPSRSLHNRKQRLLNGDFRGKAFGRGTACRRATPFDIDWSVSYGHDVYEVRHTISEALELAHKESRPSVLEITTYRYRGHSVADPDQTYRSKEEIEEYKKAKTPSIYLRISSSRKDT